MKVLVIPEDFRNDRHILQPLFHRLFRSIGRPRADVRVCTDPLMGGVNEALKKERIAEVVEQYRMIDMFILCIDRDKIPGRRDRLDEIEVEFGQSHLFFAACAWEEIETWALAGLVLPTQWRWRDVRAEKHVKERYFEELARRRGLDKQAAGGRRLLGEEAARNIAAIRQKCPDDFGKLAKRIEAAIRIVTPYTGTGAPASHG